MAATWKDLPHQKDSELSAPYLDVMASRIFSFYFVEGVYFSSLADCVLRSVSLEGSLLTSSFTVWDLTSRKIILDRRFSEKQGTRRQFCKRGC